MEHTNVYTMTAYVTKDGLRIDYFGRTLYPYKKVDDGVYIRWIRWDDATPQQFARAVYRGRACAGPSIIWEYWKTATTMVKRGRYIGD